MPLVAMGAIVIFVAVFLLSVGTYAGIIRHPLALMLPGSTAAMFAATLAVALAGGGVALYLAIEGATGMQWPLLIAGFGLSGFVLVILGWVVLFSPRPPVWTVPRWVRERLAKKDA